MPLNIVFEDDDLIVIDKPAGMVVHPGAGTPDGTLVNALLFHCGDSLSGIGGVARPGIVHRIDKDTSGLLVVAKNDAAHQGLAAQFEAHTSQRTYKALVWGDVRKLSGTLTGNIARSNNNRKKMSIVKSGGREAITHYKVLKRFGPPGDALVTLVECRLETGRTHQIRVHFTDFGHALVGDGLYGRGRKLTSRKLPNSLHTALTSFGRQALHATSLGFDHPTSHQHLHFKSKLPSDFSELISELESL
jgi:23S rRNA pseudouridine1911/1915/1917 synthase